MKRLRMENGEVVNDGPPSITVEDIGECWCCGNPTERASLCPECSDAGCNRFTDECDRGD